MTPRYAYVRSTDGQWMVEVESHSYLNLAKAKEMGVAPRGDPPA